MQHGDQHAHGVQHHAVQRIEDAALPVRIVACQLWCLAIIGARDYLLNLAQEPTHCLVLLD